MPALESEGLAPARDASQTSIEEKVLTLPPDFWLAGPPPGLLWQTVGTGALRVAYARPLPEMLS